jgi:predicted PurR-regulated permease PerM
VALLQGVLVPFAAAFAIAYLLRPAVDRLEALGVRRSMASLAVLLAFLLALSFVLVLIVPLVQGQIARLLERFPSLVSAAQQLFGNLMQLMRRHLPAADEGASYCSSHHVLIKTGYFVGDHQATGVVTGARLLHYERMRMPGQLAG